MYLFGFCDIYIKIRFVMEISKEKLMSIILESYQEMDEMGRIWDKKTAISRPLKDDEGNLIGHDMMINPENPDEGRVNVIFTCDIEEFIQNHPDLVKKLKEQYGNIKWTTDTCPKYNPHRNTKRQYLPFPGEDDRRDIVRRSGWTGESYSVEEKIKRVFNPIIREMLSPESEQGKIFNEILAKRSIPSLNIGNPKYEDRHQDEWTNDNIRYRLLGFNLYKSAQDFLRAVVARIAGKETEQQTTTYLARQFNTGYSNWEETRKSDKKYEGKTPIFNLDAKGYNELNLDVVMKMLFEITGRKVGNNSFTWTVTMTNKFGRKRPDEYRIKNGRLEPITLKDGGYLDDGRLTQTVTVQLDPNKMDEIEEKGGTILDDYAVTEGLRQVIENFKDMIESINPKSALKIANVRRSDVERIDERKK